MGLRHSRPLCGSGNTTRTSNKHHVLAEHFHSVTAAIAKGKHPVPFRTRKLSPSAPMVLRGGPRGRVGRRRAYLKEAAPRNGRAASFLLCGLKLRAETTARWPLQRRRREVAPWPSGVTVTGMTAMIGLRSVMRPGPVDHGAAPAAVVSVAAVTATGRTAPSVPVARAVGEAPAVPSAAAMATGPTGRGAARRPARVPPAPGDP